MSCPNSAVYFSSVSLCISIGPLLVFDQHPNLYYTIFLPTSHTANDEYVSKAEKFMYQDFGLPIKFTDTWRTTNGIPLEYTNFDDTSTGDCAVLTITGKWRKVSCQETYAVLMLGKPNMEPPSTCMSPGMLLYRFLCPGPVHGYSVTSTHGCRKEDFCYTGSATYSDDCKGLPSPDVYTRRSQDYNMLLPLNYVTRDNTKILTTNLKSSDQLIEALGYCAPGPCVYGSTFPIYWVQAILQGHVVDNLYTASRDEALFLNVSKYADGSDFMEGRYRGNYKGIVCYLWTKDSSFNCSYCADPTAAIIETSFVPWVMLLTVTFTIGIIVSSMFYKNSQSLSFIFIVFIVFSNIGVEALDVNIPGDIIDLLKPKTTSTTRRTTFPPPSTSTFRTSTVVRTSPADSTTTKVVSGTSTVASTSVSDLMTRLTTLITVTPVTQLRSTIMSTFTTEELDILSSSLASVTSSFMSTSKPVTTTDPGTIPRSSSTPFPDITQKPDDPCDKDILNLLWFLIMLILFGRVGLAVAIPVMLVQNVYAQSVIGEICNTQEKTDACYQQAGQCCSTSGGDVMICTCKLVSEGPCETQSCLEPTMSTLSSFFSSSIVTTTTTPAPTTTKDPSTQTKITFVPPEYTTFKPTTKTDLPVTDSGFANVIGLLIVVYFLSRFGMSVVLLVLLSGVDASCTSSQAWIESLCWYATDLSNRPNTNIPIPMDGIDNAVLVNNLKAAAATSIYPYSSCVYLPVVACSSGYCDQYGNKLTYLPINEVVPPGDYMSIVIDSSVEGVEPGQWVAVKSGTFCSNYRTVFAYEEMAPSEIMVILALLMLLYLKAYYLT